MNIHRHFTESLQSDRPEWWQTSWDYQDQTSKDHYQYQEKDFENWLNWVTKGHRPEFFTKDRLQILTDLSRKQDAKIFQKVAPGFDMARYHSIAVNNAQDYIFTQIVDGNKKVLDFGPGYGRQFNLLSQLEPDLLYIAVDGIPRSYCLQHLYYSQFVTEFDEYVTGTTPDFTKHTHLPTWKMPIIPDNFLDIVLCVQVLPEINEKLLYWSLEQFKRILKPKGYIYIRDHQIRWQPVHKIDTDKLLISMGFECVFKPELVDKADIHGIPRIYQKK